jgi:hypothetical protein
VLEHGQRLGRVLRSVYACAERRVARHVNLDSLADALDRHRRLGTDAPLVAVLPAPSPAEAALDVASAVGRVASGAAKEPACLGRRGFDASSWHGS